MKVLITGATGLVGSATARKFLAENHEVYALYRHNSDRSLLADVESEIQWIEGDILDLSALELAFYGMDFIVHTAAVVSFIPKDRKSMYKVNVEGTANVVNVCLKLHIGKLCHVSSIAAIGRPDSRKAVPGHDVILDETHRWEDSPENSEYAKTKHLAELEVWRGIAEGLNAVIVNPTLILGEGDWDKSSTQIFRYVYHEKPFYTDGVANYVDVNDVAEVIFKLMLSEISGERFLLNGGSISYRNLFNNIADAMHKKRPSLRVGAGLAGVIWRFEAVRTWLLGTKPLITKETAQSAARKITYDNEKVRKALGFQFQPIERTVARVSESLLGKI
ncbi:NAD-dependent epimerase/dehydratase family protein [Dyadobacter chenwenxiniae]|uniref:NAD-dependent epimerase/dehydratase family protein n=1 Tax=Dyadobacter chenwenxiniae TaxID=2906456 RepID=A0A9X1PPJ9_9BACT|nr:NAD-dependent epimerase/dehydratase family protein [Dyadobacter chenwenxiniae]MCF0064160.1 NAD-dependent epimerase/dehydratase family protein [Dyadobacter chenwenxiniae]UON82887.1 NAD-dependent epimerase/dehydratase family protein [Dyadobacter chenwenxiniae]